MGASPEQPSLGVAKASLAVVYVWLVWKLRMFPPSIRRGRCPRRPSPWGVCAWWGSPLPVEPEVGVASSHVLHCALKMRPCCGPRESVGHWAQVVRTGPRDQDSMVDVMVWMGGVPEKLPCEAMPEGLEEN